MPTSKQPSENNDEEEPEKKLPQPELKLPKDIPNELKKRISALKGIM